MSDTPTAPREIAPLEGYRLWSAAYDRVVTGNCENPILEQSAIAWQGATILDIGCGTGRTGEWIRAQAPDAMLDGFDFCGEMVEQARAKNIYRSVQVADLTAGIPEMSARYDRVVCVLVANHLDELESMHGLAATALKPGGEFLHIAYHPIMMFARREITMRDAAGEEVFIRNRRHMVADYIAAGLRAGFTLTGCWESFVTAAWTERTKSLAPYLGMPAGIGFRWRKAAGAG